MSQAVSIESSPMSALQRFVEHPAFKGFIVVLIVANAALLGVETARDMNPSLLGWVVQINILILGVFVVELVLRIVAHRAAFFRDAWNIFDFVIVAIALLPGPGAFQLLRGLRILRALRLVSTIPSLRRVVDGLLSAVPGIASVVALLILLLYIAAVMATLLFRDIDPQHFDNLGVSLFTLFQIMTLEGWPDIAASVMQTQRWAWVFFVGYILLATFMVLNLFIGIVVSAIQSRIEEEAAESGPEAQMLRELSELRREVAALREDLGRRQ